MKLSSVFSKQEFDKLKPHISQFEFEKDYTEDEIDAVDELLDNANQDIGYENDTGIFISDMIYKLRSNPQY